MDLIEYSAFGTPRLIFIHRNQSLFILDFSRYFSIKTEQRIERNEKNCPEVWLKIIEGINAKLPKFTSIVK